MANSVKRMAKANDLGFQNRVAYYFWLRAGQVLAEQSPNSTDLKFAKSIYANNVNKKDMSLVVMTNATIGNKIDNDQNPTESELEYTVITDNQFNKLALSYEAANLI